MLNTCSKCGLCCRLFPVNINEKEYRSGEYTTQFEKFGVFDDFGKASACGANILKQKTNGDCVYLKSNICSIHKTRPQVCRKFYCTSKATKFKTMIDSIEKKRNI